MKKRGRLTRRYAIIQANCLSNTRNDRTSTLRDCSQSSNEVLFEKRACIVGFELVVSSNPCHATLVHAALSKSSYALEAFAGEKDGRNGGCRTATT